MGRVILCTGERTKNSYYLEEPGVHVYCIEELCYLLVQNAYLLDESIVSRKLIDWIGRECRLPELGKRLYPYLNHKDRFEDFVLEILRDTGFPDAERIEAVQEAMKFGENLNIYEKRKKRIDGMAEKGKLETALLEYDRLLGEIPETEKNLSAGLWHNRGVVLAGLFRFGEAASSFATAYGLNGDRDSYFHFLAAKRMKLSDDDYVALVADREEAYEASMELEKKMDSLLAEYEETDTEKYLQQMKVWRNSEEAGRYYTETGKVVRKLKEKYCHYIAE